jgi:hypothetical protein
VPSIRAFKKWATGVLAFTQAGQSAGASTPFYANALSLRPMPAGADRVAPGTLQPLSSHEPDDLKYLGFNATDTLGETVTFITGNLPAGCAPTVDGTRVGTVSYVTTSADCEDDPNATIGLLRFDNHIYLTRPGADTVAQNLYGCNITGHEGPEPPHLEDLHIFTISADCAASPTARPTPASDVPQPASPLPWKTALKLGGSLLVCSLILCGCALKRRLQGRRVVPNQLPVQPRVRAMEMEMVTIHRQAREEPVRMVTATD